MRHATAIPVGKAATAPFKHAPTSAIITAAATRESACAGRAGVAMHARRALARTSAAGRAPASTSNASADSVSPASIVPHLLARAIAAAKDRATTVPPAPHPHHDTHDTPENDMNGTRTHEPTHQAERCFQTFRLALKRTVINKKLETRLSMSF